jgi:hypothetical protein
MAERAPYVLGAAGGAAGFVTHAVLLVLFFSQSHGLVQVFVHLLLALLLGLTALLLAWVCRRSTLALAVLLPVMGLFGFVVRPLSWAPAGVLLLAGGAMAVLSERSAERHTRRDPATAVRLTAAAAGIAAIVLALGVPSWDSEPDPGRQTAALRPVTTSTSMATTGGSTVRPTPTTAKPPASTSSSSTSSTTTSTTEPDDGYDTFADDQLGFTVRYPSAWRNTDPGEVGARVYGGRSQAFAKQYDRIFVSAAFADWQGPTYDGCYLDFIWIEGAEENVDDPPTLNEVKTDTEQYIDELIQAYPDVKLLQPVRDFQLGLATGFKYTWSLPVNGLNEIVTECTLVADGVWYFIALAASEEDWKRYEPVFKKVLESFVVNGSSSAM